MWKAVPLAPLAFGWKPWRKKSLGAPCAAWYHSTPSNVFRETILFHDWWQIWKTGRALGKGPLRYLSDTVRQCSSLHKLSISSTVTWNSTTSIHWVNHGSLHSVSIWKKIKYLLAQKSFPYGRRNGQENLWFRSPLKREKANRGASGHQMKASSNPHLA